MAKSIEIDIPEVFHPHSHIAEIDIRDYYVDQDIRAVLTDSILHNLGNALADADMNSEAALRYISDIDKHGDKAHRHRLKSTTQTALAVRTAIEQFQRLHRIDFLCEQPSIQEIGPEFIREAVENLRNTGMRKGVHVSHPKALEAMPRLQTNPLLLDLVIDHLIQNSVKCSSRTKKYNGKVSEYG